MTSSNNSAIKKKRLALQKAKKGEKKTLKSRMERISLASGKQICEFNS